MTALFWLFIIVSVTLFMFGTTGYLVRYVLKQAFFHFVAYLSIPVAVLLICFQ